MLLTDSSTASSVLPPMLATLTGAGAAILGGWASAHFTARQARRRATEALDERRRVLASVLLDELANIEAALAHFPDAVTRRRFRPLPDTPVLDRMLAIADAFDASTVVSLLSVREMIRAHRRVSKDCHALFRRYRHHDETEHRTEAERGLVEIVADASQTALAVLQAASSALLELGAIPTGGERIPPVRHYTSGAAEEALRWTALHAATPVRAAKSRTLRSTGAHGTERAAASLEED